MKKYLMTGVAAIAMCAAFTSCSNKDDIEVMTQSQIDKAKYDQAFLKYIGGSVASGQDWGFSASANSRMTRAIQPSFNFPSDADASKFLADVPTGVKAYTDVCKDNNQTDGFSYGTAYIDASWTGKVNIWGGWDGSKNKNVGGTLYVKGNCDFSNRSFYLASNSELYLLEGARLTLSTSDAANLQANTMIYMAANSKIVTSGELKLNNGLHIYNHGTIEANKLSTNSNSVLYNVGTVSVTTKISVENTLSVIVNDGTITAADLNTAGSGKIQNNKDVTITGTTVVNSNNNTWVNNGHYHTGNFLYNAASDEVINNCYLEVDEDFNINLGDNPGNGNFKMDAGSGVLTKNFNGGGNWSGTYAGINSKFNGGPFYIYMGAASVFKVTNTATMNATKAAYGIYGPASGDYAVFSANKIEAGKANQGYEVTYGGNLYVYAENGHFANGYSGQYPYIDLKDNAKIFASGFEDGKPAVKYAKTECCPGFDGGSTPEIVYDLRIMGEDLSASEDGDFDFNDIVIDVKFGSPAKVCLRAAGGTLPLYIKTANKSWEVHNLFNVATGVMVNTAAGKHKEKAHVVIEDFDMNVADAAEANNIKLIVVKNGVEQELTARISEPAAKIAVPITTDEDWLNERVSIKDVKKEFVNWATENRSRSTWWTGE